MHTNSATTRARATIPHNAEDDDGNDTARFPYAHGFCNTAKDQNTVMAYQLNRFGSCRDEIPYFSSPLISYQGTPTGDAAVRDNRRVLLGTADRVANFRQAKPQQLDILTLPFVTRASNTAQQGFVRVINNSDRPGDVRITAIDDNGRPAAPVTLSLGPREAQHFNSVDLETGNSKKGLSGRTGSGDGNWRLVLTTDLEIEHLAYIRTDDGFVTNMHEVAAETEAGSNRYHVPFFNPGSNTTQESKLRLINPGSGDASIEITGVDDKGRAPPLGPVGLTLDAGNALMLTASALENGHSSITGRLGAGEGKWRLSVSADRPIQVMSLLELETGHLTNLSRGQDGVTVPPPPPPGQPDLIVESPSADPATPSAGQLVLLSATVRNQGGAQSAATRLRFFRSSDATISRSDTALQDASVSALPPSGTSNSAISVTAPSAAGTYYYGACVDTVASESDTGNNCSRAVSVTVRGSGGSGVTGQVTLCTGSRISSSIASVTMGGTIQAHEPVSLVRVSGYAAGSLVGIDFLGDMSAGESKAFSISGIISTTASTIRCTAEVTYFRSGSQIEQSLNLVDGGLEPLK